MSLPSKVQDFIEGNINYANRESLPTYITQQVELRKFLCSTCLSNLKCEVCHCKTPQMFYSPHKEDSKQRWSKFLTQKQWEALTTNIDQYYSFIKSLPNGNI